jgi:hypothetical protein
MARKRERWNCSIDGCNKMHLAKGYCHNHYVKFGQEKTGIRDNTMTWKCITTTHHGKIYNPVHIWEVHTSILGYGISYKCINCQLKIPRREFKRANYALYKDFSKYD